MQLCLGWNATCPHFPGGKGNEFNVFATAEYLNLILRVSEGQVCLLRRPWQGNVLDLVARYLI